MKKENYYTANIEALRAKNPIVVEWLEADKGVDWITEIKSKNGQPNLLIRSENQEQTAAHCMDDPTKEARDVAKEFTLTRNTMTVLIGSGCGYFARAIWELRKKGHQTIVVEPVAAMVKQALKHQNLVKAISNYEIIFATSVQDVEYCFATMENRKMVENWYVSKETMSKKRPEYDKIGNATFKTISTLRSNTGTVMGAAKKIADNDMISLPYVIRHRGVKELAGLFKGKPGIVVSTGPSLAKNIHLLMDKEVQRKFVIVAVGQALRILLGYDIRPDFICSVDFGIVNMSHYKGLLDSDVPMVAINRTYADLLKNWQKHKFICASVAEGKTASSIIGKKGAISTGGSVSHLATNLTAALGCDPIVLIGQDLAYSNDESHNAQVDEGGSIKIVDDKITWTLKDPNSAIPGDHEQGEVRHVLGYYGGFVPTYAAYASYLNNFERMFEYTECNIINATEGGAKIKHCRQLSLKKVIEEFGKEPIDKTVIEPLLTLTDDYESDIKEATRRLKLDIKNLDIIEKYGDKAIRNCNVMMTTNKPKQLMKLLKVDKDNVSKVYDAVKENPLVYLSIYAQAKMAQSSAFESKADTKSFISVKTKKDRKIRINRTKLLVGAAMDVAKSIKETYNQTLETFEKYAKDKTVLDAKPEPLPDLKDTESYFKAGNFCHPLADARSIIKNIGDKSPIDPAGHTSVYGQAKIVIGKSLDMRLDLIEKAKKEYEEKHKTAGDILVEYNELLEEARLLGREKKHEEAIKVLKKALGMVKDDEMAKWGMASALHQLNRDKEAIPYFEKLIKKFPDELDYRHDCGWSYLKSGNAPKAFEYFSYTMDKTDKFDRDLKKFAILFDISGQMPEAVAAMRDYLEKYPADFEAWNLKGDYCKKTGDEAEAEKCYETAKEIKN